MTRWTKEQDAYMLDCISNKMSYKAIGDLLGFSRNAVSGRYYRLQRQANKPPTKNRKHVDIKLLKQCAKDGMSLRAAHVRMGIGRHLVESRAAEHGLKDLFIQNGRAAIHRNNKNQTGRPSRNTFGSSFKRQFRRPYNTPMRGDGINLKIGRKYLHQSGEGLTDNREYAWRGFDTQVTPMIEKCGYKLLVPTREIVL